MRARNGRDRRARKGRYSLRDLAGFADIARLLANDVAGERFSADAVNDDDDPADFTVPSAVPRRPPGGSLRRRR